MKELKHKNPSNFANSPKRASEAGKKGGVISPSNFKHHPKRASIAGRKGGKSSGKNQVV